MLKLLAFLMFLCVALCGLIVLPILILGGLLKVLFLAVALPFRVLGAVAGGLLKVGLFLVTALIGLVFVVGGAILLPLIPVLLLGLVIWAFFRLLRPRPTARVIS